MADPFYYTRDPSTHLNPDNIKGGRGLTDASAPALLNYKLARRTKEPPGKK